MGTQVIDNFKDLDTYTLGLVTNNNRLFRDIVGYCEEKYEDESKAIKALYKEHARSMTWESLIESCEDDFGYLANEKIAIGLAEGILKIELERNTLMDEDTRNDFASHFYDTIRGLIENELERLIANDS